MSNMKKEVLLKSKNISKNFGSTKALKNINIEILRGEICGLIGENGSGKSTFSSIVSGILKQSEGELYLNGKLHEPENVIHAQRLGVGMIVQELGTISGTTVADNIFLGQEKQFGSFIINRKKMIQAANEALKNIGVNNIDASTPIDHLNMQDRKLVEVAKVMMSNPDVLIVDESTTALSQQGRNIIYSLMKRQTEKNKSVIFISHDLEETIEQCDRLIVLRDGDYITEIHKNDFDEDLIKKSLVGREMEGDYYPLFTPKLQTKQDEILIVKDISTKSGLSNVSFQLHKGEILGIGGLSHCGMHELGKVLFGAMHTEKGEVTYKKTGEVIKSTQTALKYGIGYVSKDRDREALVLDASIKDNIAICGLDKIKTKGGIILPSNENKYVDKQVNHLSIKCTGPEQLVQSLSGGNKQKVVFGKWVGRDSEILVLDCPTRGVDIGVKAAMYKLMDDMRKSGKAIVMISEELQELIGMSDRIMIMKDGVIKAVVDDRNEMHESTLINFML